MSGAMRDVMRIAALLDRCGETSVLTVDFFHTTWYVGDGPFRPSVPALEVRVHAATWADAEAVAAAYDLMEVDSERARFELNGGPTSGVWREWRGWLPSASRNHAVSVEVAASEWNTHPDGSATTSGDAMAGAA